MTKRTASNDAGGGSKAAAPKRLGRRSAEESRATRHALLDSAILEFAEKGMEGARIDEIAKRAGVTKGAIYTHFDGREDLLVEACRSALRSMDVNRVATEAADLPSYIEQATERLIAPEAKPARMLIAELYASAARSKVIGDLLGEWHADFVEVIKDRVPEGAASPEIVAAGLNFLHVALSHIDVYESMNMDRAEMVEIFNRLAAALIPEK